MSHRCTAVVINGVEYDSIAKAAQALNVDVDYVRRRVDSVLDMWASWHRKGDVLSVRPSRAKRAVKIGETVYESVAAAAKTTGLSHNTVYARITSESPAYKGYQFISPHPTRVSKKHTHLEVVVDGVEYSDLGAAARSLNMTPHGLRNCTRRGYGKAVHYRDKKSGQNIT